MPALIVWAGWAIATLLASMTMTELRKHFLPGNEAMLKKKLQELGIRQAAAKAGALKQITLTELRKQMETVEQQGIPDSAVGNLMNAIMGQKQPRGGPETPALGPDQAGPPVAGDRRDQEGMMAALTSLQQKTQKQGHVPAISRMTGPPTHG